MVAGKLFPISGVYRIVCSVDIFWAGAYIELPSRQALKKYIQANNKTSAATPAVFDNQFNKALRTGVEKGDFTQPKGKLLLLLYCVSWPLSLFSVPHRPLPIESSWPILTGLPSPTTASSWLLLMYINRTVWSSKASQEGSQRQIRIRKDGCTIHDSQHKGKRLQYTKATILMFTRNPQPPSPPRKLEHPRRLPPKLRLPQQQRRLLHQRKRLLLSRRPTLPRSAKHQLL